MVDAITRIQKFYGPIYAVLGIALAVIEIGVTDTPGGTPSMGTSNISIADNEVLDFSEITNIDVTVP